jgi:hypothetical protein
MSVHIYKCVSNAAACIQQTREPYADTVSRLVAFERSAEIILYSNARGMHMKSEETIDQFDRPANHRFVLHLLMLYGAVILILGFVWGMMIIK